MKKAILWLILGLVLLTGCNPRTYFLLDSRGVYRYDRAHDTRELILEFSIVGHRQGQEIDTTGFSERADTIAD